MGSSRRTEARAPAARLALAVLCAALTAGAERPASRGQTAQQAGGGASQAGGPRAARPRGGAAPDEDALQRAETLAAQAFRAYERGEPAAALALYRQAYAAAPSADISFNIARVYDVGLGEPGLALRHYREYLAAPDADPARVELALRRVADLTAPELGPALPARRLRLPAAASRAPAAARAHVPLLAPTELPGPPSRPAPEPPPRARHAEPWTPLRVGAIVAGSLGMVGLGLGAGFGVAALSDAGTARDYCSGNRCRSQRGVDAAHAASKNADIATASFAVGGGLLAAGVALFWFQLDERWASESLAAPALTPLGSDTPIGLGWSGRW